MLSKKVLHSFYQALLGFEEDDLWNAVLAHAEIKNPWFTHENATKVLQQWRASLELCGKNPVG